VNGWTARIEEEMADGWLVANGLVQAVAPHF
jgi:hypothetical protein